MNTSGLKVSLGLLYFTTFFCKLFSNQIADGDGIQKV